MPAESAYVFVLYGKNCEQYFLGVMAVAWSLMKHFCAHRRVLMHTLDVPRSVLDTASASNVFNEIVSTDYIEASEVFFSNPQAHRRFGKIFTKYRVLGLERYDKVLLLDADLHVRSNLDHLFHLQPPAAMARGPTKPPEGARLPAHTPVNAGVMLLRPDAELLQQILTDITGPRPRRLPTYNSPDADYLTEHPAFCGLWTSIPLECNYQLEFEHLDPQQGTVRFSAAREAHFSDEGASMPWARLKVTHFSGAKPWVHLLDDASALQRLQAVGGGYASLGEKLVEGIREYAQEVATMQGLCSQLQLGEGTLWREMRWERALLPCAPDQARARLHAALPQGGRWFEGQRPQTTVWIPPGEGLPIPDAPLTRPAPVAAFLEVATAAAAVGVGDMVRTGVNGNEREFEVVEVGEGGIATIRRRIELPSIWQRAMDGGSECPYYHNMQTGEVQWAFPDLPQNWQAVFDKDSLHTYYHNTCTNQTIWDPPEVEELEKPVGELEISSASPGREERSDVTIWRRSFVEEKDAPALSQMKQALAACAA